MGKSSFNRAVKQHDDTFYRITKRSFIEFKYNNKK